MIHKQLLKLCFLGVILYATNAFAIIPTSLEGQGQIGSRNAAKQNIESEDENKLIKHEIFENLYGVPGKVKAKTISKFKQAVKVVKSLPSIQLPNNMKLEVARISSGPLAYQDRTDNLLTATRNLSASEAKLQDIRDGIGIKLYYNF